MRGIITLKPKDVTPSLLFILEKKGLIRTLWPTKKVLACRSEKGTVDTLYSSSPQYGSHKLICVRLHRLKTIKLTVHPDNEEFIIFNLTPKKFKPLCLVVGMHKFKTLEQKARKGILSENDFMVLRLRYNDPQTSFFIMLKETPHCEVSLPGKEESPIFFVTEPSRLKLHPLKLNGYRLRLSSA